MLIIGCRIEMVKDIAKAPQMVDCWFKVHRGIPVAAELAIVAVVDKRSSEPVYGDNAR
jgi:hypothetical protein